jgi:hypothetical protein
VTSFSGGPMFAHGGSGIILSRRAMQLMIPKISVCIKKYQDCWAEDIRLSLCLRDQGILIENIPDYLFNNEPPVDDYNYPANGCNRPITFHHLLPDQIQKFYDLETKDSNTAKIVTYVDIHNEWINGSTSKMKWQNDHNISYGILNNLGCGVFPFYL